MLHGYRYLLIFICFLCRLEIGTYENMLFSYLFLIRVNTVIQLGFFFIQKFDDSFSGIKLTFKLY